MCERRKTMTAKQAWEGTLLAIQSRIRLLRSFDRRSHSYLGYTLRIDGSIGGEPKEFLVAIGKAAQGKHEFQAGDILCGESHPVPDSRQETVDLYKTSKLTVLERSKSKSPTPPPWRGVPLSLEIYRERGHRRLAARTYQAKCITCIWGCHMPVEMIVDQWKPQQKKYRTETFCYGPKSCSFYQAGPTRKVPGRKSMMWEEEDWVDEEATSHRSIDD